MHLLKDFLIGRIQNDHQHFNQYYAFLQAQLKMILQLSQADFLLNALLISIVYVQMFGVIGNLNIKKIQRTAEFKEPQ